MRRPGYLPLLISACQRQYLSYWTVAAYYENSSTLYASFHSRLQETAAASLSPLFLFCLFY
jgi:hypothetical protein